MQSDGYPQQYSEDQPDASPRIILELKNVQNDVCEIGERVQRMEDQMTSMLQMMEHITRLMISKTKKNQKPKNLPAPKPEFRNGSTEKEVSEYLNLAEALQENILVFLEEMPFQETLVLDQLSAKGCLTEDDCEYIQSFNNRFDGIRTLIRTIKRRDSKTILEFLDIIGIDSPHIKKKVHECFNDKQNRESNATEQMCPTCLMIKIVDLKDIADILWREKLLSDELYDIIIVDAERLREILWNTVLHYINKKNNSEKNISILVNALEKKYGHVAILLKGLLEMEQNLNQLQCGCYRSNRKRKRLHYATSSTQGSYTSNSVPNIPKLFSLLDQSSSLEESAEDTEPKLDKLKENFDFSDPSKYDNEIGVIPNIVQHYESEDKLNKNLQTYEEETSKRQRHSSGKFEPVDEKLKADFSGNPGLYNRTVSTVVVCEADSTTNDDERSANHSGNQNLTKECTGNTPSKLDVKAILNKMDKRDVSKKPVSSDVNEVVTVSDEELLEDLSSSRSAKERELRQQFYQRQKSSPAGITLTESKAISNFDSCIGIRERQSRKSKRSLKRKERRTRNANTTEESCLTSAESGGGGIPYNPMWNKMPQTRNTRKWGYPEARRHNLMANTMAELKRKDINQTTSDTELRVGESDTPDLSEFDTV